MSETTYTYADFLEVVKEREILNFLKGEVDVFTSLVGEDEVVRAFYVKNLHNNNPIEVYFFLEEKVIIVKAEENHTEINIISSKVEQVKYMKPKHDAEESVLEVTLANKYKLEFRSMEDSSREKQYFHKEYRQYVENLFNEFK